MDIYIGSPKVSLDNSGTGSSREGISGSISFCYPGVNDLVLVVNCGCDYDRVVVVY